MNSNFRTVYSFNIQQKFIKHLLHVKPHMACCTFSSARKNLFVKLFLKDTKRDLQATKCKAINLFSRF